MQMLSFMFPLQYLWVLLGMNKKNKLGILNPHSVYEKQDYSTDWLTMKIIDMIIT